MFTFVYRFTKTDILNVQSYNILRKTFKNDPKLEITIIKYQNYSKKKKKNSK